MSWKYFIGSCMLAAGLLFKFGAPLVAVTAGVVLALCVNVVRLRR